MIMAAVAAIASMTGCAVVKGRAGDSSYMGWAFGEKASATLAGLNITETQNTDGTVERGVGVDSSGAASETKLTEMIGKVILAGLAASTSSKPAQAAAKQSAECPTCGDCADGNCSD